MLRLFFALWPDEHVRAEIQAFATSLPLKNARLVAEKNIHITLAFLGNVDEPTCNALIKGANSIRVAPFSLSLDSLGWWKKPKIAWLAPSAWPDELSRLAEGLHVLSRECGMSLEERSYRPHLTLARKVTATVPDISPEPISWNI
ncbi:MAG: RNA 2',3'-cyclic phosphodiesterase, partial [Proteobacteria bacterium]|nr:RNA 2',3'-cyclic phosphodiesterase [Pseudomonadota bacterium]